MLKAPFGGGGGALWVVWRGEHTGQGEHIGASGCCSRGPQHPLEKGECRMGAAGGGTAVSFSHRIGEKLGRAVSLSTTSLHWYHVCHYVTSRENSREIDLI